MYLLLRLDDDQCNNAGGSCKNIGDGCENGRFRIGLCSGGADRKCCTPFPSSKTLFCKATPLDTATSLEITEWL